MNREIKFRAWDKEEKEMIQDFQDTYLWENHKDYELLQFTGLKDKNDKEIYEGDIVKRISSDGILEMNEVKYIAPRFNIGDYAPEYSYTVIGNIYENKDLLK